MLNNLRQRFVTMHLELEYAVVGPETCALGRQQRCIFFETGMDDP
jgi:hypothetical protein